MVGERRGWTDSMDDIGCVNPRGTVTGRVFCKSPRERSHVNVSRQDDPDRVHGTRPPSLPRPPSQRS